MTANASVQKKSNVRVEPGLSWRQFTKRANPAFVTVFTIAILAIFLMPFLYMIFTSLKNQTQVATTGAPIWPAKYPTYTYPGTNKATYTLKVNKSGFPVDQVINMSDYAGKVIGGLQGSTARWDNQGNGPDQGLSEEQHFHRPGQSGQRPLSSGRVTIYPWVAPGFWRPSGATMWKCGTMSTTHACCGIPSSTPL